MRRESLWVDSLAPVILRNPDVPWKERLRSWQDGNRRSVLHHRVDLAHLAVCHRDATRGPVIDPREGPRRAVDEDVAAGIDAGLFRGGDIGRVGIVDTDGQVELAVGIAPVDDVIALRRAAVAFLRLVAERVETKLDLVDLEDFVMVPKRHAAGRFADLDAGDLRAGVFDEFGTAGAQKKGKRQEDRKQGFHDVRTSRARFASAYMLFMNLWRIIPRPRRITAAPDLSDNRDNAGARPVPS